MLRKGVRSPEFGCFRLRVRSRIVQRRTTMYMAQGYGFDSSAALGRWGHLIPEMQLIACQGIPHLLKVG